MGIKEDFMVGEAVERLNLMGAHYLETSKILFERQAELKIVVNHEEKSIRRKKITDEEREMIDKIEEEYGMITAKIGELEEILADETKILGIVRSDLIEMKENVRSGKYIDEKGDARRTEIASAFNDIDDEDLIEEMDCVVTVTHNGYIKRMPTDTYKSQRRGGRGITGMTTREEDFVEGMFTTSTHQDILFFSTRGYVYKLRGYQIPEATRTAKGMAIVNLLPLEPGEKITAVIAVDGFKEDNYLTQGVSL